MKIALAHDSFTQFGGAERVVQALHELYPDSPIFTLVIDAGEAARYEGWDIRPSSLQKIYNKHKSFKHLLPLIPHAIKSLDFRGYDVVLSSSSAFLKGLRLPKSVLHINYCHTPTRFVWSDPGYLRQETICLIRPLVRLYLKWFRFRDYQNAQKVDAFIANSVEVQKRIKRYYKRESTIIYPFIDTDFWRPSREKQDYFLVAGRLQPHKHNEAVIKIFNRLGLPLHVAGSGRQEAYLKSIAAPNVKFLGKVSDETLRDEYSGALALLFPQLEDFGLMPLEAAACGTASIGQAKGGSLETIISGLTGELIVPEDWQALEALIKYWRAEIYRPNLLKQHADKFNKPRFLREIAEFVNQRAGQRGGL